MTEYIHNPILECRNVSRKFMIGKNLFLPKAPLHAVSDLSLKVKKGEVLGIVGESGCGKTTLAKMLLGIIPPSDGEVFVQGTPTSQVDNRKLARMVQPIFQDPYSSLNPRKTIEAIISSPLKNHNIGTRREQFAKVEEIMSLVGLPSRLIYSYANQLSGGQRQRVAIARALILKPSIVVCDEPTSALDVSVQAHILNLLLDLREKLNLTYIFISHDLAVVEKIADWVAVMYLGKLVELGKVSDVFGSPKHPYTKALLGAVLTPDPRKEFPDFAMDQSPANPMVVPSGCSYYTRCNQSMAICENRPPNSSHFGTHRVNCQLYEAQ